jgi:protoheme IX farnesyltransferase
MNRTAPGSGGAWARVRAYLELGKPRLSALAVFAVVAGCYMGWPMPFVPPPGDVVLGTTAGTFLIAVAAAAFNMYRERHLDLLMQRTQGRPLPSGRLQPVEALAFGTVCAAAGVLLLLLFANLLATLTCAVILVSYVAVYTPMKLRTPLNTLVGAIPGGLPPVVGYVAMQNRFGMGALVLFAILFCWQIPHFLAIAWRYRDDYARAGMRMLPAIDPDGARTRLMMLLYVAGLGIASLVPFVTRMSGQVYLGAAVCLDVFFFVPAVFAALTRYESAMRMTFLASIVYLPLLLLVMVLDRQVFL